MDRIKQTRSSLSFLSLFALLCSILTGCTGENEAATQVLVVVNSDLQVGTQLTAVEVEVQSADGTAEKPDAKRFELTELQEEGRFRLPLSFGVVPGAGGSNNIRLIVRGFGPGAGGAATVVVEQKSLVTFEQGTSQRLTVFLGGACFRVLCPNSDETCYPSGQAAIGVCTPVSEAQLEKVKPGDEFDGIVLSNDSDAGSDAGDNKQDAATTPQGTLTVTPAGDGVGTVTSSVPGIDCGTACSASFDLNSVVTLTASAGDNSEFSGWSGGTCTGTDPCVATIAQAATITATFVRTHYRLHVTMSGEGVGVVSSGAGEISCGSDCEENFARGSVVELTAATTTGTVFLGWNGGGCSGAGSCTVTMNAAADVSAIFACVPTAGSQSFSFVAPGGPQVLTRPLCVRTIKIDAMGGAGGYGREQEGSSWVTSGYIGYGGRTQATVTIKPTDVITVFVGGRGGDADEVANLAGAGGYNGGGAGAGYSTSNTRLAGGGGGASDVRVNYDAAASSADQLATRIVVAGGGGGGSPCGNIPGGNNGGSGGGLMGGSPTSLCYAANSTAAVGGSQSAGGAGGSYLPTYGSSPAGGLGVGGSAVAGYAVGGGGGGGYYGGGAGMWEAGAGGSGFAISTATEVTYTNDYSYSGYVTVSW